MSKSQQGKRAQAKALQAELTPDLCGPWFHVSKDLIAEFTSDFDLDEYDDEYTWFSRSPDGGGHGGGCVLMAYVIEQPNDCKVFDAEEGDKLAKHNGEKLKGWWFRIHKSEVDKLMVVQVTGEADVAQHVQSFLQDPEYVEIKEIAVQKLDGAQ